MILFPAFDPVAFKNNLIVIQYLDCYLADPRVTDEGLQEIYDLFVPTIGNTVISSTIIALWNDSNQVNKLKTVCNYLLCHILIIINQNLSNGNIEEAHKGEEKTKFGKINIEEFKDLSKTPPGLLLKDIIESVPQFKIIKSPNLFIQGS